MSKIEGACLCGEISYHSSSEPVFSGICHCKDCQRRTGSAYAVVVSIPDDGFSVTGPE